MWLIALCKARGVVALDLAIERLIHAAGVDRPADLIQSVGAT